jgi:uncharacterized membrane protein YqjE
LPSNDGQDSIATALAEISDKLTQLVHDEIELAKAEVGEKIKSLRAGMVGIAIAAVFGLLLAPFGLLTLAWGLNSLFGSIWLGFLVVLVVLLVGAAAGGWLAWRKLRVGAPIPTMAIDEAKKIQATVTSKPGAH